MTSRQRLEQCWAFNAPDRVPFIPAAYEQKAFLLNNTPSRVARNADLFHRALLTEHDTYQADALVIGMDVYKQLCTDQQLAVRRNISPHAIKDGSPESLAATARQYLAEADGMPGFILGTAVLPYGTPTENVLAIRNAT